MKVDLFYRDPFPSFQIERVVLGYSGFTSFSSLLVLSLCRFLSVSSVVRPLVLSFLYTVWFLHTDLFLKHR